MNQITHILAETNKLCIQHEYEYVELIDKENNQLLMTDDFYGDPECALIDKQNKWAIVAGIHLTLWLFKTDKQTDAKTEIETHVFQNKSFNWICRLRQIDDNNIDILIDPWSEHSAIWQLNIPSKSLSKKSDFLNYRDSLYTENIIW